MLNKNIMPGLGLSFVVALISYVLNLFVFKGLGAATVAILLGIVLGNIYFKQPILFAGTAWSEKKLLEFSVMFLGATVTFQTIQELGWSELDLQVKRARQFRRSCIISKDTAEKIMHGVSQE